MTELAASRKRSNLPWLICSLLLLTLLLVRASFSLSWPINHDCAMYVAAGKLLLAGKIPYIDFVDLNPPLVFYVNTMPAWLSQVSGLDAGMSFAIFVWLLCFLAWLLSALLLLPGQNEDSDSRFAGPILFGFAAFNFLIGEWGEFGQRQHLASVAMMPFFLCRWLRSKGRQVQPAIAIGSGLLFGVMLLLVPQYLLVPAAIEIEFQRRRRDLSTLFAPEVLGAVICGIAYATLFLTLPSPAKEAFFHRWMPLTVQGYAAYNGDWQSFITFPTIIGCFPLFFIGVYLAGKHRCSLTVPLILWCAAAYAAMLMQLKGWYNHYIPFFAGGCLLVPIQIEAWARDTKKRVGLISQILITTAAMAACAMPAVLLRESWHYPQAELKTIVSETAPGDKVTILSTGVPDIYPVLLEANRENGSRYLFLFPIEMLRYQKKAAHTERQRQRAAQEETRVLGEIEEDIRQSHPKLILIPCGDKPADRPSSMLSYFESVGLIDRLKSDYVKIGQCTGRRNTFVVWKRKLKGS